MVILFFIDLWPSVFHLSSRLSHYNTQDSFWGKLSFHGNGSAFFLLIEFGCSWSLVPELGKDLLTTERHWVIHLQDFHNKLKRITVSGHSRWQGISKPRLCFRSEPRLWTFSCTDTKTFPTSEKECQVILTARRPHSSNKSIKPDAVCRKSSICKCKMPSLKSQAFY